MNNTNDKNELNYRIVDGKLYLDFNGKYIECLRKENYQLKKQKKRGFLFRMFIYFILFISLYYCFEYFQNNLDDYNKQDVVLQHALERREKVIKQQEKVIAEFEEKQAKLEKEKQEEVDRGLLERKKPIAELNDSDLLLLAKLIQAESDIKNERDMLYVGNVAINRLEDPNYWPMSLKEVVFAPNQYEVTWNGRIDNEPSDEAIACATRLINGERFLPANVFYQATFKQGSGVYEQVGNHYYCFK